MSNAYPEQKLTVGEAMIWLKRTYKVESRELMSALKISHTTYLKIERDQRELSFLLALRLCKFYKMDIHDFINMLKEEELERKDLATLKFERIRDKKKAEA